MTYLRLCFSFFQAQVMVEKGISVQVSEALTGRLKANVSGKN